MQENDTQFNALLYVYNELDQKKKSSFEYDRLVNDDIREELSSYTEIKMMLDKCTPVVRPSVVENLLERLRENK